MLDFSTDKLKQLLIEIENYLDMVDNSALIFHQAIKKYLNNKMDSFSRHYVEVTKLESKADELRNQIKYKLYAFMLIPSARGDIWGLLENLDNVVDMIEKVVEQFSIEKPDIPDEFKEAFLLIAETSSQAVENPLKHQIQYLNVQNVAGRSTKQSPLDILSFLNFPVIHAKYSHQ